MSSTACLWHPAGSARQYEATGSRIAFTDRWSFEEKQGTLPKHPDITSFKPPTLQRTRARALLLSLNAQPGTLIREPKTKVEIPYMVQEFPKGKANFNPTHCE
jgi:hypothetical protein